MAQNDNPKGEGVSLEARVEATDVVKPSVSASKMLDCTAISPKQALCLQLALL